MTEHGRSCWHPYQFYRFKKVRKNRIVVATTNGGISRLLSAAIHFSLETVTAKTVSHTRPRLVFVLFSASLRANTTLSVNNWPILYVSISAGDAGEERLRVNTQGLQLVCTSPCTLSGFHGRNTDLRDQLFIRCFISFASHLVLEIHSHVRRASTRDYGMNFLQTS